MSAIRLATRRSPLALAQSRAVAGQLARLTGREVRLVEVTTRGDRYRAPLARIGGTGVFVAAVRQAVLDGRAHLAVHSLKDLPTAPADGLELAAVPAREDPRDALVARDGATLAQLPPAARVGTGSPRRMAQLAAARPDLHVVDIRGNVDSRLARVGATVPAQDRAGDDLSGVDLDGVVLAVAGLARLEQRGRITEYLDPAVFLPAPGQGALALEVRSGACGAGREAELTEALSALDDPGTRAAVTAERTLLATLGAGCSAPVGALAMVTDDGRSSTVHLRAVVARGDGTLVRTSTTGPTGLAAEVGRRLAGDLLADLAPATAHGRGSHP